MSKLDIGARLLQARKAKKFTRAKVAGASGITALSLSHYEHGIARISAERLATLCDLYGVTYQWMLTGVDTQVQTPEFQAALELVAKAGKNLTEAAKVLKV